jgi:uncharacterized protein YbjT (DUF2867 family)
MRWIRSDSPRSHREKGDAGRSSGLGGYRPAGMRILVTGVSGFAGAALVPRLLADGHELRGFARDPSRVQVDLPVVRGDALTGEGLDEALDGIDVAYFLIHSMERGDVGFAAREAAAAAEFVAAARRSGLRRVVYLGGIVPSGPSISPHLSSRLAVEEALLAGVPEAVALRASIVVGATSRSFRFLVRLVERTPVIPLPAWRTHRTRPIDAGDVVELLAAAAATPHADGGLSLDIAGPDVVTYAELIEMIRDALMVPRASVTLPVLPPALAGLAAPLAAAITGEDPDLIGPLMASLEADLLPRDDRAAELLGVPLRGLHRSIALALRDWEAVEELGAR